MRQSGPLHASVKPPFAAQCPDIPLMPMHVPRDLDDWMRDRNLDLQEALSVGNGARVSELISKLSAGAAQMSTLTGTGPMHGLRGVRVGEVSHPGPPKPLLRRYPVDNIARNVVARIDVSSSPGATLLDEDVPSSVPPTVPASSGAVREARGDHVSMVHVEPAQGVDDGFGARVAEVVVEVASGVDHTLPDEDSSELLENDDGHARMDSRGSW